MRQHSTTTAEFTVSIVRMGMAEDDKFGDGYEAIFGKKAAKAAPAKAPVAQKSAAAPAKKPAAKKPAAKKK